MMMRGERGTELDLESEQWCSNVFEKVLPGVQPRTPHPAGPGTNHEAADRSPVQQRVGLLPMTRPRLFPLAY